MEEPVLDDYEKSLVRFFAQQYLLHQEIVNVEGLPPSPESTQSSRKAVLRLREAGLIEVQTRAHLKILPACVRLTNQWDTPSLPDYRDRLTTWFWSRPWSIVVYLVIVGVPALVGYVAMLKTVLEWIGVLPSSLPKHP